MSAIRHFDIPHIVRFGRSDDEKRETWMRFYRAATCFEVTIHDANIADTPFEAAWSRTAFFKRTPPISNVIPKWNDYCDCVIGEILPTLQKLAPADLRSWTTLEDYIQTASYKLSLHKASADSDSDSDQIKVRVDEGPVPKPAFEIHPEPISTLPFDLPLPSSVQYIPASSLQVLDQHKHLRQRPYKVRLPDSSIAYLITTNGPVRSMPAGTISNPSLATIEAQLNLHRLLTNPDKPHGNLECIPQPLGIVITSFTPNTNASATDLSEGKSNPPRPSFTPTSAHSLAGVLLTYIPHARPLADTAVLSDLTSTPDPDLTRSSLHKTLRSTIETLHSQDPPIIHGNINPHTIMLAFRESEPKIEPIFAPYLIGFSPLVANHLFVDLSVAGTKEADMQGLESTFGESGWLAHEIKKARREVPKDQRWEKRALTES